MDIILPEKEISRLISDHLCNIFGLSSSNIAAISYNETEQKDSNEFITGFNCIVELKQ